MAEFGSWDHVQPFSPHSLPFRLRGFDRLWELNSSHQHLHGLINQSDPKLLGGIRMPVCYFHWGCVLVSLQGESRYLAGEHNLLGNGKLQRRRLNKFI